MIKPIIINAKTTAIVDGFISVSIRCVSRYSALAVIDLIDSLMPSTIGLSNVNNVQIAATPIVPAPMKRTLVFHTVLENLIASKLSGFGRWFVKYGTKPPQAIIMPTKMAIPLAIPIRNPAPNKAEEKPNGICVAPAPTGNQKDLDSPNTRKPCVTKLIIPAKAPPDTISFIPPDCFTVSPGTLEPTFKISAAARPSGYGKSLFITIARRNGMVNNTPRQPPQADNNKVSNKSKFCQ